jgi:hypothetical protein
MLFRSHWWARFRKVLNALLRASNSKNEQLKNTKMHNFFVPINLLPDKEAHKAFSVNIKMSSGVVCGYNYTLFLRL